MEEDDIDFNENNSENGDFEEKGDDDYNPDDDENGYFEDLVVKVVENKDEEPIFDINSNENKEEYISQFFNPKRKKNSNFPKMTKYEYSKLYGTLADYVMNSNIKVPEEMKSSYAVRTGDPFIISRYWIENRTIYPLPTHLVRCLYTKITETVNPSSLILEDDLSFKDDHDDTERFHYNFRDGPYQKDLPVEDI